MVFPSSLFYFIKRSNYFAFSGNNSYLAIGYLKCGIFVQLAENKPLPSRYLSSYTKNVTTR